VKQSTTAGAQGPLEQADKAHFWHPFTQMKEYEARPPIEIVDASGVYFTDATGKRYLDGIASWWVNPFGHRHPRLDAALKAQIDRFSHVPTASLTHAPAVRVAEALVQVLPPGLSRVFYSDDGSTAVETALKMCLQAWRNRGEPHRTRFISLQHSYHGDTVGAVSLGDVALYHELFRPLLFPVFHAPSPALCLKPQELDEATWLRLCLEPLEEWLAQHAHETAAMVVEPLVQGAVGMYTYPPEYLRQVRALCNRFGIYLIVDEVAMGFGRTGKLFACEHAGISPDVICLSKALTGGYMPMGITVATDAIYQCFWGDYAERKTFFHGHSYTGNPLGCALALEVLAIFREESIIEGLAPKIATLQAGFESLRSLACVGDVRGCGMLAALDLVDPSTREPLPLSARTGYRVSLEALKRGLYIRPLGDTMYLLPPLVITEEELRWSVEVLEASIRAVLL
jgi:adenosylmethionine-8-amino-7-oxononanoate aminotransferase